MVVKREFVRKISTAVLASSLVLSMGTSVMAAPASTKDVSTGRTEQNRMTGVITPHTVPTLAHNAVDVTLTGTIVIDGPQLVLLVNGINVSKNAVLTQVADKTWTYQYHTNVGSQTGNVTFSIDAYTVYKNGKTAGDIHTRAASSVGQTVHVPFVQSYDYTNLNWASFDRNMNVFSFAYNLVKVWDDGVREVVQSPVSAAILGTETYQNSGFEIAPPVVVRSFEADAGSFTNYNRSNNTYDLAFNVTKQLSNGTDEIVPVTQLGVDAGQDFVYTAAADGQFPLMKDFTFSPPVTIRDITANAETFSNYNRADNTFTLTYDLIKVLSKGSAESETITTTVDAAATYVYTASDSRAPGYTKDLSFTPSVVFRDFTFAAATPVWIYNSSDNTYSVSFVVDKTWSNGTAAAETMTLIGFAPGASSEVLVTIEGVTHSRTLTAPAAPAPAIPSSVQGTVSPSSITSTWTGNNANGDNVQEAYTLTYTINGTTFTRALSTNFTSGTGYTAQHLTFNATYNGQTVAVSYTLPYIQPASTENNTSAGNGNGNGNNGKGK